MGKNIGPIALIAHSNSGISHYTYSLADALSDSKYIDVHFITNSAFECDFNHKMNVAPLFGRSRWLPFQLLKVWMYILKNNIHVLHFQSVVKYPLLTILIIIVMKLFGRKIIFTAHDVLPHYDRWYHKTIMRMIYKLSNGVIVHSKNNLEIICRLVPTIKHTTVIPHGLYDIFASSEPQSKSKARQQLNLPMTKKILLFFGRIDKRKGAEALISQMPSIVKMLPDLLVLMVGRSAYSTGYLENYAAGLGVVDNLVVIDKWIADSDVNAYFVASDAVILPYLEGSTSGVIKIALTTNVPVIATRVGELPEVIEETSCGILVDIPFSESDIKKIISTLSGFDQTSQKNDSDRSWAKDMSWDSIAIKTLQFYRDTVIT